MQHQTFAFTTPQAIRFRGVKPHTPYSRLRQHGHWDGAVPIKLDNGRLLWKRDEILRAEGIAPAAGQQSVDVRAYLAFVEETGLPLEDRDVRIGIALLSEEADLQRNAAHTVDEFELIAQATRAGMARLGKVQANLSDADKRRVAALLRFIADMVLGSGAR